MGIQCCLVAVDKVDEQTGENDVHLEAHFNIPIGTRGNTWWVYRNEWLKQLQNGESPRLGSPHDPAIVWEFIEALMADDACVESILVNPFHLEIFHSRVVGKSHFETIFRKVFERLGMM